MRDRAEMIDSLEWMKRQLELSPGAEASEMASLTGEILDLFEDTPIDICYLTIPEAEEAKNIDKNTAFVMYLGRNEAENELMMIWEPAEGLHLQETYRDKLKAETIIPRESVHSLLKALSYIASREPEENP